MIEKTKRLQITSIKHGDVEVSPDDRIYLIIDIKKSTDSDGVYHVTTLSQQSKISVSLYGFYESIRVIDQDL